MQAPPPQLPLPPAPSAQQQPSQAPASPRRQPPDLQALHQRILAEQARLQQQFLAQQPPLQPQPNGVPRADDLAAGIRASLAGRRQEELEEQLSDDERNDPGVQVERNMYRHMMGEAILRRDAPPALTARDGVTMICEGAQRYDGTPAHMKVRLHQHQLAELRELQRREIEGCVHFATAEGRKCRVVSNVGVLGDEPGYGKTVTMIALMGLAHDLCDTHLSGRSLGGAGMLIEEEALPAEYEARTLVIVPPRLVKHWTSEIESKSKLRCLVVTHGTPAPTLTSAALGRTDVVLASTTTYGRCMQLRWRRVVVDEADTIRLKMLQDAGPKGYGFVWLVTGSYDLLATSGKGGWVNRVLLEPFRETKGRKGALELLGRLVVRGEDVFVASSSNTPPYVDECVICEQPDIVKRSREFINDEIAEMIASGDIQAAIIALGGKAGTHTSIMDLLKANTARDLHNLELHVAHVRTLDIDEHSREQQLRNAADRVKNLRERLDEIERSINGEGTGADAECKICYSEPEAPTLVLCCRNMFCGRCLIAWFNQYNHNSCPMCRQRVSMKTDVLTITAPLLEADKSCSSDELVGDPNKPLKKIEALRMICKHAGRVLVFANHPGAIARILQELRRAGVACDTFMGTNTSVFARFRAGELTVLVLDPRSTAGIALIEADSVALYHAMEVGLERQAIGRAQRVGRTQPLKVFRLLYEIEQQRRRPAA
jgi:SNF2-related domain/Zinc finger, C3HC4 type (RING finger)